MSDTKLLDKKTAFRDLVKVLADASENPILPLTTGARARMFEAASYLNLITEERDLAILNRIVSSIVKEKL